MAMADSRDDIVSSIAALSDSIREKVDELQKVADIEDTEDLIRRGHNLQKRSKQRKAVVAKKLKRVDTSIQIQCFLMEDKGKNTYVRKSPLYEVSVFKSDTYDEAISKMAAVLEVDESDDLQLFSAGGTVIVDTSEKHGVPWTIGSYLSKKKISSDKLKLGIGCLTVPTVISKSSPAVVSESSHATKPIKAAKDDVFEIVYCEKNNAMPYVWLKIGGCEKADFEKNSMYQPEDDNFIVQRISQISKGGSRTDLLMICNGSEIKPCFSQDGRSGKPCYSSFGSPVLSQGCIPLIVLDHMHPKCRYDWKCLEKPDNEYPNTPVVYVKESCVFKCMVTSGQKKYEICFDVSSVPIEVVDVTKPDAQKDVSVAGKTFRRSTQPVTLAISAPAFNSLEFSAKEICAATNSFDAKYKLGEGGFGKVYRAFDLRCEGTDAAVKVLSMDGCKALCGVNVTESQQLRTELKALMKFRHPNILTAMGYCFEGSVKAIVYEFMRHGSLYDLIHCTDDRPRDPRFLSWETRIMIVKDMFRGITFLHEAKPPLIHQDIKSSNILLDDNLVAKIGDFGFALELPGSVSGRTLVTAPLIGRTEGYYPSELMQNKKLSPLVDVYSCGVVTLETYSGLKAFCQERCDSSLASYTEDDRCNDESFLKIADNRVEKPIEPAQVTMLLNIINSCLARHSKRPCAKQVLELFHY